MKQFVVTLVACCVIVPLSLVYISHGHDPRLEVTEKKGPGPPGRPAQQDGRAAPGDRAECAMPCVSVRWRQGRLVAEAN